MGELAAAFALQGNKLPVAVGKAMLPVAVGKAMLLLDVGKAMLPVAVGKAMLQEERLSAAQAISLQGTSMKHRAYKHFNTATGLLILCALFHPTQEQPQVHACRASKACDIQLPEVQMGCIKPAVGR